MADVGKVESRFDQVTKGKIAKAGGTFNPVLDIRGVVDSFIVGEWLGMREGGGTYNSKVHTLRVTEGDMKVKPAKDSKEPARTAKGGDVLDFFGTTVVDRTFGDIEAGSVVAIRYKGKRMNKAGRHAGVESLIHEVFVIEGPRK